MNQQQLQLLGFSYHVGSKCSNMKAHTNTINTIIHCYLQHCYNFKLYPKIIDIGGGFEHEHQLSELNNELYYVKNALYNYNINLIAEPGRLFSKGSLDVIVNIIAVREKYIDNIKTLYLTINDSIYHTFQGKYFDGQTYEPVALYKSSEEIIRCVIFGQTCDSLDLICENVMLPYPSIGDRLMFPNIGAYSLASANGNFNGFQTPIVIN